MYPDPEGLQPSTSKSRFMMGELHGLIDALQNLHIQISSILASARIRMYRSPRGARESLNIADSLKEYIVQSAAEPLAPLREAVKEESGNAGSTEETSAGSADHATPQSSRHHQENALSQYLSSKLTDHEHHPDMCKKMQAKTIEHIKKAIRLTKQGDAEGARINAERADSAMKTAIEYMSEDEYRFFRDEIVKRLDALREAN